MSDKLKPITVSKHEIKSGIRTLYDLVGLGLFNKANQTWVVFKRSVVKYYGMKGASYENFRELFREGDWILTRVPIEANRERMYDVLLKISSIINAGGFTISSDERTALMDRTKEIYSDLLEAYRLLSGKIPNTEQAKEECLEIASIIGDLLMDLRNLEPSFNKLGDFNLYKRYNEMRKRIGDAEAITPRVIDAFRTANVKQDFQKKYGELFKALEDLLSPVQEKDLKTYEDKILQMIAEGRTIEEIAKEIDVNSSTLIMYMNEKMKINELPQPGENDDQDDN